MDNQELSIKQIFSVVLGVLTVIFICHKMGINNELALFLFAVFNLFIMLMAHVYVLGARLYAKEHMNKKLNSVLLDKALGIGMNKPISTLKTKDTIVAIFFCVCPIISLWMFTTTFIAAFYDIFSFFEKHTVKKYYQWRTNTKT